MFWYNQIFGPGPLPKNMTARKLARFETDGEFLLTFSTLLNLVTSIFKWTGLPDYVDPRTLELSLLWRGFAAIAPYHGLPTNMGAAPSSGFNVHGEFVRFFGYGWNGFSEEFENFLPGTDELPELQQGAEGMFAPTQKQTGVLIRDNYNGIPMVNAVFIYSKRLTDTMRRLDTVSYNLVWPTLLEVDDGQKATARQLIQDHDDNLPTIIGRQALDDIGLKGIDMGAKPETLGVMWGHYNRLMNRLMEIFGIQSDPTIGKAERVTTMETSANNARTGLTRDNRLHCRQTAAERMNQLYGWTVSVDYDENITENEYNDEQNLIEAANRTPGSGSDD